MSDEATTETVWQEMAKQPTCMLITRALEGGLRARPMGPLPRRDDNAVWFVTDRTDAKDNEIEAEPQVCLTFSDEDRNVYLSVTALASPVNDPQKLKELWTPAHTAFFPDGPADPNALLIKAVPSKAEIWDGPNSDILISLKMLTSAAAGTPPNLGTNQKVSMAS